MKKKLLASAVSTAMLSTIMIAGVALAENRVETKVTSEPIQSRTTCDKAGGFSLEFDTDTEILQGDKITIDLDYVTPANFAALCRNIDFMIAPAADSDLDDGTFTGWDATTPVTDSAVTSTVVPVAVEAGVVFHVTGNASTQRITVDVIGANPIATPSSLTVGAGVDDNITIKFLDQSVNADFAVPVGYYVDSNADADPATHLYTDAAVLDDNTLCIDVSEWDAATVNSNFDSQGDKYTFIPSNPQIAHIVAAASYQSVDSKGQDVGTVPIGETVDQVGSSCVAFDNDNNTGYCNGTSDSNSLIINRTDGPFASDDYILELTILVNGEEGANGVYFDDSVPQTGGADTLEDAGVVAVAPVGASTYYNAAGAMVDTADLGVDECAVDTDGKAVMITTAGHGLNLAASNDFLKVDLPALVYDADEVQAGDEVVVQVTVTRAPCGELITTDHMVATMAAQCSSTATDVAYFPYFTEADGADFWDGLAIVNNSDADGTATITMREADGDVAQATVDISAYGMYVNTLSAMVADGDFTLVETVEGTLGNARSQIMVNADGMTIDGFGMIGNPDTGESMGYLPRVAN